MRRFPEPQLVPLYSRRSNVLFWICLIVGAIFVAVGVKTMIAQSRTPHPPLVFRMKADPLIPLCVEIKPFEGTPEGKSREFVRCVTLIEIRPLIERAGRSLDELRNTKQASR